MSVSSNYKVGLKIKNYNNFQEMSAKTTIKRYIFFMAKYLPLLAKNFQQNGTNFWWLLIMLTVW